MPFRNVAVAAFYVCILGEAETVSGPLVPVIKSLMYVLEYTLARKHDKIPIYILLLHLKKVFLDVCCEVINWSKFGHFNGY